MTTYFPLFSFNVKKHRAFFVFMALLCASSVVTVSCSPTWLATTESYVQAFLPIAGQVASLVLMFNPGTITPEESAKIRAKLDEATGDVTKILDLAKQLAALSASDPTKPGLLKTVNDLIQTANSNLVSILTMLHITNGAVQTKIEGGVGLLLAAIQQIVAKIPGAVGIAPVPVTPAAAHAMSVARTAASPNKNRNAAAAPLKLNSGKDLKSAWNRLIAAPSGDSPVDQKTSTLVLK